MGYEFIDEDEMIECYQEASMTTKDDILSAVKWQRLMWNKKAESDTAHTAAYYNVLNSLVDRFVNVIEKTRLFDAPYGMWAYVFEIRSDGIALILEHAESVDFDDDKNPGDSTVDESFELIKVHTKMLSVEEYGKLYGVEPVTVRQWIRRGKIRTAKKFGKEWRIPELTDIPGRGYRMGQYEWDDALCDVPEEYSFLHDGKIITLTQDGIDKKKFYASMHWSDKIELDGKEREKLELFLISHPQIRYISDIFGCYSG